VSALGDAEAHLAKAREFYETAEMTLDLGLFSAATSNAVTSGINSKDAICLKLTGKTGRAQNHTEAVIELQEAGKDGAAAAPQLRRLLNSKTKAQYQSTPIARREAEQSLERARSMLEVAQRVVVQ